MARSQEKRLMTILHNAAGILTDYPEMQADIQRIATSKRKAIVVAEKEGALRELQSLHNYQLHESALAASDLRKLARILDQR